MLFGRGHVNENRETERENGVRAAISPPLSLSAAAWVGSACLIIAGGSIVLNSCNWAPECVGGSFSVWGVVGVWAQVVGT